MSKEQETGKIILSVLSTLEIYPDTLGKEYMFVSGIDDSNQTEFERMSNNLEIGTVARSNVVGLCLLFFLRLIIDDHWELPRLMVADRLDDEDDDRSFEDLTNEELIDIFKDQERDFMVKAPISDGKISRKLLNWRGYAIISKSANKIDLWNLPRIRKGIRKLYGLDRRESEMAMALELIRKRKRAEGDPFWKGMPKQFINEFVKSILKQEEIERL